MGRKLSPPRLDDNGKNNTINNSSDNNSYTNDQGFYSIRDRFPLKRNPGPTRDRTKQFFSPRTAFSSDPPPVQPERIIALSFSRHLFVLFFDIFLGFCLRYGVDGDAEFNYGDAV